MLCVISSWHWSRVSLRLLWAKGLPTRWLQQPQLNAGDNMGMQASPEDQLPQHRGKPNSQQAAVGGVETPPELQKISLKIRSLERGMPGSLSSPSLLAEIPDCGEADVSDAAARASSAKEEKMQRTMSWNQAPAIISRMTSWKEAGKDYSAMQVLLTTERSSLAQPVRCYRNCTHSSCVWTSGA